jgi:hypothetical protein
VAAAAVRLYERGELNVEVLPYDTREIPRARPTD